mgnify:FL=1
MCAARGLPAVRIGVVDSGLAADAGEQVLTVAVPDDDDLVIGLAEMTATHNALFPELFG